nr:uncharacterized protein LOC113802434 [Penaeus vannamei]
MDFMTWELTRSKARHDSAPRGSRGAPTFSSGRRSAIGLGSSGNEEEVPNVGLPGVFYSASDKAMVVTQLFESCARPKKPPSTVLPRVLRDEDPCLVSAVTESILPLLPDRTPVSSGSSTPLGVRQQGPQQVLEMVNLRDGDRTISLPSLNVEHNYNQILSELVLKL